jgi:hypothetical protein
MSLPPMPMGVVDKAMGDVVVADVPQEENDNVTTVKNMYNKFTPAKKAKHFQLRNPGKTLGLDNLAERPRRAQPLWLI